MAAKVEKPALELCDEALFLLRRAPASVWTIYLLGVGPFLLGLLYFWTDMTRGVLSETRLVSGAFFLSALFVWMKTCQSVFAARLWSVMSGIARPWPKPGEWLRVAFAQSRVQPWGIFLVPLAMALAIPFAWVYAYYQNATVIGAAPPGQSVHKISFAQAMLWPRQNHVGLGGISGLGMVVCVDLLILFFLAPQLLITFFGVKEVFHPSAWLLGNTTFLALLFSLSYLLFDPLVKAFYTLRCFYGESLTTGEDLRARLTMAKAARGATTVSRLAKVAAVLIIFAGTLGAAEPASPPTPEELNESISRTLKSEEYNWHFPRKVLEEKKGGWLNQFFTSLGKWIVSALETVFDWIGRTLGSIFQRLFPNTSRGSGGGFTWPSLKEQLIILGAAAALVLVYFILKRWRPKGRGKKAEAVATASVPDLSREDVTADQLPEDQWLALATKLAGEGELRLAIRALFLSALAILAGRQWIALARFKSNRDYERELRRRAASVPQALSAFGALTAIYNRIWYGLHEPSADLVAECEQNLRVLKS
jgi:hypothetical protein